MEFPPPEGEVARRAGGGNPIASSGAAPLPASPYSPLREVSLYPDLADFRQQNPWSAAC